MRLCCEREVGSIISCVCKVEQNNFTMDSIFHKLFHQGDFELILQKIFLLLDGNSLHSCSLVCEQWRGFILRLFQRKAIQIQLRQNWGKGVASSRRIPLHAKFMSMKVDPTSILVGLEDGSIELYERLGSPSRSKLPQAQKRLKLSKHSDLVRVVDLNLKYLVSGSWDETIKLWNRKNGELLDSFEPKQGPILCLHIKEDLVYYTVKSKVCQLKIIQDTLHKQSFCIDHNTCNETITIMSMDHNQILTGGLDCKVKLWDDKSELLKVFEGHQDSIRCVYLKGLFAISGSKDKTAKIWDTIHGLCLRTIYHSTEVRSVFFNKFAVFTGDECTDLYLWKLDQCLDPTVQDDDPLKSNGSLLLRSLTGHNGLIHSIQATSLGVITGDITGVIIERDFWNCIEEGPSLRILRCAEGVNCMTCDSKNIVCGLLNKKLAVYDRESLKLVEMLNGHNDHIWSVDMTPSYIVSGSWDFSVILWKRSNLNILDVYSHPDHREISGVKFNSEGNLVYVSCLSGALSILKIDLNNEKFEFVKSINCQKDPGEIYSLAVDDTFLLTGHTLNTTCVQIWNIQGEELLQNHTIREENSESIIWNLHLAYPLALVCRDNEILDIYHLVSLY